MAELPALTQPVYRPWRFDSNYELSRFVRIDAPLPEGLTSSMTFMLSASR